MTPTVAQGPGRWPSLRRCGPEVPGCYQGSSPCTVRRMPPFQSRGEAMVPPLVSSHLGMSMHADQPGVFGLVISRKGLRMSCTTLPLGKATRLHAIQANGVLNGITTTRGRSRPRARRCQRHLGGHGAALDECAPHSLMSVIAQRLAIPGANPSKPTRGLSGGSPPLCVGTRCVSFSRTIGCIHDRLCYMDKGTL
jgi:hypothetical protein